ncbi:MAG: YfhO family protein, partial [Anaerolineae bacterium]|nr:YfhO family protein [Anaerolineae bacterium]
PSFEAPQEPPLVWLVPGAIWAASDNTAEAELLKETWNPEQEVILSAEAPTDALVLEASPPLEEVSFFEVVEDTPTQKKYRVVTDGSGYLVLATSWYPGWSVQVDGEKQTLYRANLAFMAVEIPEGGGEVTFRYFPSFSIPGILISLLSLVVCIGLIAFSQFRQQ